MAKYLTRYCIPGDNTVWLYEHEAKGIKEFLQMFKSHMKACGYKFYRVIDTTKQKTPKTSTPVLFFP